jgi:hypothetical protein
VRRVVEFQLGDHFGHAVFGQAVQTDERCISDQFGDVIRDFHVVSPKSTNKVKC